MDDFDRLIYASSWRDVLDYDVRLECVKELVKAKNSPTLLRESSVVLFLRYRWVYRKGHSRSFMVSSSFSDNCFTKGAYSILMSVLYTKNGIRVARS